MAKTSNKWKMPLFVSNLSDKQAPELVDNSALSQLVRMRAFNLWPAGGLHASVHIGNRPFVLVFCDVVKSV